MENNTCGKNRIPKGLDKNKAFVEIYQNLSEGGAEERARLRAFALQAVEKVLTDFPDRAANVSIFQSLRDWKICRFAP